MRGVTYRGPRRVRLDELPMPRVTGPRDAVVRVTATGVCGTDLHPYRGEIAGFEVGTVLGHEFAGIVVDAGAEVPFPPGERVFASDVVACGRCAACGRGLHYQCAEVSLFGYSTVVGGYTPGGQAEYVRVPFADVVLGRTPDGVADEQALFVGDVLTTAYAAVLDAGVGPGGTAVVVGAGPVGVLAARCALVAGATTVVVVDPDARRRALAAAPGLVVVPPEELAAVVPDGAEAVVEAVGSDTALATAVRAAGPGGTVAVAGAHREESAGFPSGHAFARELTVRFTVGNPIRLRDRVLPLVRTGRLDPAEVVTHRLPLAAAAEAYDLLDRREALKVVLHP